jgi:hypothetical protein
MAWLGFNLAAIRRGLFYGSAIGVGWTLAQIIEQWHHCGGAMCRIYP